MGCCDQKRFLETDNLSENIIRTVLFNLKVKNLTFNTFYHQILDKILQNKDNYYKIVDEFYLYSTEENIYRDAQLYTTGFIKTDKSSSGGNFNPCDGRGAACSIIEALPFLWSSCSSSWCICFQNFLMSMTLN